MIVYDIQKLVKIYPGQSAPANDGITLQIEEAQIFGFLGDNGAGKSTLVKQMTNLLKPTSGSISIMGKPIQEDFLLAPSCVGYMPQGGMTLNSLSVGEALYFTAHLRGLSRQDALQERDRLLQTWEIEHLKDKSNQALSGGEKRLLQIAVAMAGNPPILILDEPTNDLDPLRRNQVWECIRQTNRENGTTVIFITHNAIEAEKVIHQVGILCKGKLVAMGKPSVLKASVDQKLRLELHFQPDCPPALPGRLQPVQIDAGRWLIYIHKAETTEVLNSLDLQQIDDFRLYSATLEDLYLHYAK